MPEFTPNSNLYKWNKTDTKQTTITEMANNANKIDSAFANVDSRLDAQETEVTEARGTKADLNERFNGLDGQLADIEARYSGKKIKVVGCVVRNEGNGWVPVSVTGHDTINVASVTNDSSVIQIYYSFTAKNVISFVATPDETFALKGYSCGASVGLSDAKINIATPFISGYIYYDGTNWVYNNPSNIGITGASWTGSGTLRITHIETTHGFAASAYCRDGIFVTSLGSVGSTYTDVILKDYAGALITSPNANMKIYLTRGTGKLNPSQLIDYSGNIWCLGVFEV